MDEKELLLQTELIRETLIQRCEHKYLVRARTALELHNEKLEAFETALRNQLEASLKEFREQHMENLKTELKNIVQMHKEELTRIRIIVTYARNSE